MRLGQYPVLPYYQPYVPTLTRDPLDRLSSMLDAMFLRQLDDETNARVADLYGVERGVIDMRLGYLGQDTDPFAAYRGPNPHQEGSFEWMTYNAMQSRMYPYDPNYNPATAAALRIVQDYQTASPEQRALMEREHEIINWTNQGGTVESYMQARGIRPIQPPGSSYVPRETTEYRRFVETGRRTGDGGGGAEYPEELGAQGVTPIYTGGGGGGVETGGEGGEDNTGILIAAAIIGGAILFSSRKRS